MMINKCELLKLLNKIVEVHNKELEFASDKSFILGELSMVMEIRDLVASYPLLFSQESSNKQVDVEDVR